MSNNCPLCKVKGKLIEDQFRRIFICENFGCGILKFEDLSVTAL